MSRHRIAKPDPGSITELREKSLRRMEAVKEELRLGIEQSGLSTLEVNRRLGNTASYIANLLGNVRGREPSGLRVDTMFSLLDILELEPHAFLNSALARAESGVEDQLAGRNRAAVVREEILRGLGELASLIPSEASLRAEDARALLEDSLAFSRTVTGVLASAAGAVEA